MAVSIVMTGTGRNCTLTSGSSTMTVSSATGLVVGATIQGAGIPTGTRIASISGTTVAMENGSGVPVNATAGGTQSLIFSSVWGSVLTISMNASGDTSNVDAIFNAGFGVRQRGLAVREIYFPGALGIIWRDMVAGSVFDFQNWTLEFGSGGYWAWSQSSIFGELRGGYLVNGTQFIKSSGPTFISNNFKNNALGGANMFIDTATGAVTGNFRMNNLRVIYQVGSNTAPFFACGRMNCIVDNMILDYQGGSGPNAGISAAFGVLNNTTIVRANSGIGNPNGGQYATINGLSYSGIFTDTPQHKFAIPNGYVMEGYAPQVLSNQFLGGFQDNTTETFANIDLSTAGWGVDNLKTRYQRFGGPNTINFPRRVTFEFNDSTGANLAGVTLYIRSGSTSVINAVQAGDYSANTQALVLQWTGGGGYRLANTITDTINQVAQVRRYGFIEQSTSYSLNLAAYSQPFFMLNDTSLTGIDEATAAAITTAGINWTTKTITPTADLTYDQINARIAWELAQTANSAQADPRTVVGSRMSLATGWTLVVNTGRTISEGANIKSIFVPTVTLNGLITGLYSTTAGNSKIAELTVSAGSSIYIGDNATAVTKLFSSNVGADTYRAYYAPSATPPTVLIARELYGFQRFAQVVTLADGLNSFTPVDIPDVGISEPVLATVQAYTTIDGPSKRYDRTAAFRLTEQGIKLGQIATRSGTSLEGTFSVVVRDDAPVVFGVIGNVITIKAASYDADAKYVKEIVTGGGTFTAFDTELIGIDVEDANGDSSVNVQGTVGGLVDVWKCVNGTINADFETGTKIASNISAGRFRFTGTNGFKLIFYDKSSLLARDCSMSKGNYVLGWYVYDQATGGLTQSQNADFATMVTKVSEIFADVNSVTNGFVEATDSLHALRGAVDGTPAATATAVWAAETRTLTSAGSSGATLAEIEASTVLAKADALAAVGTAVADLPEAVRTELATELGRLDVAVSTRSTLTAEDVPEGLTAAEVWANPERTLTETAGLTPTQAEQLDALSADVDALGLAVDAVGTAVANVPGAVRTELATELGRIDVAVSTRSTLTAEDIPEGLTAEDVWTAPDRSLTEAAGLTTGQAEQLRKVAQLHGVGVALVVTETSRTAGDVSQTLTTDEAGSTTVSAA